MNNKLGIVALIVAVVALGITYFAPTPTQVREVIRELGAIPGTSVDSNCFTIGGLEKCYYRRAFSTATSTYCAIRLPSSTSTLDSFTARLDTSTSTAGMLVLATSSVAYAPQAVGTATTSEVASRNVPGATTPQFAVRPGGFGSGDGPGTLSAGMGGGNSLSASTSINTVFEPDDYLVLYFRGAGVANDTITSAAHTGYCSAVIDVY